MTEDQIKAAIANTIESAIWEQSDEGTFEYGANHQAIVQDMAAASAAAVMALVGPKPLVWKVLGSGKGRYRLYSSVSIAHHPYGPYFISLSCSVDGYYSWSGPSNSGGKPFETEAQAKAAAQADDAAAHWGRMVLADMIGGE